VGIAEVVTTAYQDPTTEDTNWLAVELKPVEALPNPVTLASLKGDPFFAQMDLIRLSRLSVGKVTPDEYKAVLKLGGKKYNAVIKC
jgi:predicted RNA-binding protein with PUA-like domain